MDEFIGKRFGRLVVVGKSEKRTAKGRLKWDCKCDCGDLKSAMRCNLTSGKTQSCGCLHREAAAQSRRKYDGNTAFNKAISAYKANARLRELKWELSRGDCEALFQQNCNYCGAPPSNVSRSRNEAYVYSGIDRIDSSLGYSTKNTVSCCATCNGAKSTMATREFLDWVERVFNHSVVKGA